MIAMNSCGKTSFLRALGRPWIFLMMAASYLTLQLPRRLSRPLQIGWSAVQVWVKVVEVRDDGSGQPKINCSMKVVSQEDGSDLDPTNAAANRGGGGGGGRGGGVSFGGPQSDAPPEVCNSPLQVGWCR